ncbi:MAG TPA: serine/threonine-protein kinase [Tepidisphaeraceae bacterium]|nr:serine/threonine-protein kinase [Tepidisphaeraceae bacterium]
MPANEPTSLFGYDIVSRLGQGAGSTLYVVCKPDNAQLYVLKHVVKKTDKDIRFIEQLQNEFEISRHFRHPVLRKCVELKINKRLLGGINEAGLVMELVDGTTLDQQPLLPIPKLIDVFTQVAHAIFSMHHQRIIHCDLKPSNIIVCPDGSVKLIDFGQACKSGTVKDRVQGTPDFIAPEQVRLKAVDQQTDIFNYGATLYWALTGVKIPTLFTVPKSEWSGLKEQKYPTPRDLNPAIPEPLSRLAMWCSKISRGSRPADMDMVLKGLQTVKDNLQPEVVPQPSVEVEHPPEEAPPPAPTSRRRNFEIPQTIVRPSTEGS